MRWPITSNGAQLSSVPQLVNASGNPDNSELRTAGVRERTSHASPRSNFCPASPGDAIVVSVVTRAAPHGFVDLVEEDRVDGAGGSFFECERVAHLDQLVANGLRCRVCEQYTARTRLVH